MASVANSDAQGVNNQSVFTPTQYPDIARCPIYDLMNGDPQLVQPYLTRSTIPVWAKWVPIACLPCDQAFATIDGSIRSHVYHVLQNKPANWTDAKATKAGVILGITRAAMMGLYKTTTELITPDECAAPVLRWAETRAATPTRPAEFSLHVLVPPVTRPAPAAGADTSETQSGPVDQGYRTVLTGDWNMPPDLAGLVNTILKAGMTVIPIQGHNLMVEGHHYLSERRRLSFKAFKAVEAQLFTSDAGKELLGADEDFGRDVLWHKSGHPVSIPYKISVATRDNIKASLVRLDLGSAAVRLPACESELKGLGAYKRLAEAVKPAIEGYNGVVDCGVFQEVMDALTQFPVAVPGTTQAAPRSIQVGGYVDQSGTRVNMTTLTSRADVISYAQSLMTRNQHTIARMFGFYVSMLEATQGDTFGGRRDSLADAKSLDKLKSECLAMFGEGRELHRDMMAMRAKARREGTFTAPNFYIS